MNLRHALLTLAVLTCTLGAGKDTLPQVAPMDRHIAEADFKGVGFTDVVDFLRDISGINIYVDWAALDRAGVDHHAPITCHLTNVKISQAMRILLDAAQGKTPLKDTWQDNILLITTFDALKNQPATRPASADNPANKAVAAALDHSTDADFRNEALGSLLKQLAPTDVTVEVDWGAIKADGITPQTKIADLKATGVSRSELLSLVLLDASAGHAPLAFAVRGGAVLISTQARLDQKE